MTKNALGYKEFMQLALENYEKGGDSFYECWDEREFNEYTARFGAITKTKAKKMFREELDIERDRAGWGW